MYHLCGDPLTNMYGDCVLTTFFFFRCGECTILGQQGDLVALGGQAIVDVCLRLRIHPVISRRQRGRR